MVDSPNVEAVPKSFQLTLVVHAGEVLMVMTEATTLITLSPSGARAMGMQLLEMADQAEGKDRDRSRAS